jgi:hypothetical protein
MNVVLIQRPIPRLDLGHQTGSIPLGICCLATAAEATSETTVAEFPEAPAELPAPAGPLFTGQRSV